MAMRLRRRSIMMGALACGAGACGGPPPPAAPPIVAAPEKKRQPRAIFDFHSGFWLNLHLRVHYAATGTRPPPLAAPLPPFAPAWDEAVHHYKQRFGERGGFGLLFDPELVAIGRRLSEAGSMPTLADDDVELTRKLRAVAEIVRVEWDTQDRVNMKWAHALSALVDVHGESLVRELEAVYGAPWTKEPIRVDVSAFAGPVGAYTVDNPAHTIISSVDAGYGGDAALEMIFHEASHLLSGPLERQIDAAAKKRGVKAPEDLWHAILFYTTGVVVSRVLPGGYVPYATKQGLWNRWPAFSSALQDRFQPYLDKKVSMAAAVDAVVDRVAR